jgi:hypothetical protein
MSKTVTVASLLVLIKPTANTHLYIYLEGVYVMDKTSGLAFILYHEKNNDEVKEAAVRLL